MAKNMYASFLWAPLMMTLLQLGTVDMDTWILLHYSVDQLKSFADMLCFPLNSANAGSTIQQPDKAMYVNAYQRSQALAMNTHNY